MKKAQLFILWNTLAPLVFNFGSFLFISRIHRDDLSYGYLPIATAVFIFIVIVSTAMNIKLELGHSLLIRFLIILAQFLFFAVSAFTLDLLVSLGGIQC
jgi:hypothetical protein